MSAGGVLEGVLAVNKPNAITSTQVLRDLQRQFNPSKAFAPWLEAEQFRRSRENSNQKKRRRNRQAPQVKIGHGGTLDPLATGVLITGIGKGTKQLQAFLDCTKTYEATVLFGVATDTYDRLGKVLHRAPHAHITREKVEEALAQYRGKIMQRPPIFSALWVQGKRLYDYAREGKEIPGEIQERPVEVLELEMAEWMEGGTHPHAWPSTEAPEEERDVAEKVFHTGKKEVAGTEQLAEVTPSIKRLREESTTDDLVHDVPTKRTKRDDEDTGVAPVMSGGLATATSPTTATSPSSTPPPPADTPPQSPTSGAPAPAPAAKLRMTVTSGFYVRSLCHDLGAAVGSRAIMSELVRTRQGQFDLAKGNVLEYAQLQDGEATWGPIVERLLGEWNEAGREGGEEGKKRAENADTTNQT
ncbi:MAG: hypothetical protein M1838_006148 [Thelocarpon superellum]|nr:MAG: hypothetical protein M1838_006148 [Thelocarpon superellum]